ncbi:RHS repeat domain-containing protein [Marinagarivorans algicola]|uniref:RHS repeat domain-containing protein n=1 Tax=Marinagarivorans algicola TaxID=1513270 RepID=UPI0037367C76
MTNPISQIRSGVAYFYQTDHLGTPQELLKSNGEIVWKARYDSFGQAELLVSLVGNSLRFPGQYYDQESQLHYNYFRDYDPLVGRYIQSDPVGFRGGINWYIYAYQNPLVNIDPTGRWVPYALLYAACMFDCINDHSGPVGCDPPGPGWGPFEFGVVTYCAGVCALQLLKFTKGAGKGRGKGVGRDPKNTDPKVKEKRKRQKKNKKNRRK